MAEFKSYEPGVEVLGEVLAAFMAGFPEGTKEMGLRILKRNYSLDTTSLLCYINIIK